MPFQWYGSICVVSQQPCAVDAANGTLTVCHVRHRIDEPVRLRSEANSLWRKGAPPKVIPRKVASMPATSHQSMFRSFGAKCCLCQSVNQNTVAVMFLCTDWHSDFTYCGRPMFLTYYFLCYSCYYNFVSNMVCVTLI